MDDSLLQLTWVLAKLSLLSLGGLNTMLGELQTEVVGRGWMTTSQFTEAFALSQLTPGPSISFFVIPIGYAAAGVTGALVALLASALPPVVLALAASRYWNRVRESRWPRAIRIAITPIAIGLILASALVLARGVIYDVPPLLLAVTSAAVLLHSHVQMPAVLLGAASLGAVFLQP